MFMSRALRSTLLAAVLPCAFAAPAFALAPITYVSSAGTDAGSCDSTASACRTFAYAIGKTAARGEMKAVTPGDFGPFVINKAITVTGVEGASVGQTAPADAIVINAPWTDAVNLIGLTVQGLHANSTDGVRLNSAALLTVKNCVVRNFFGAGIAIVPILGKTKYLVEDTIVAKVGGHGVYAGSYDSGKAVGAIHRVSVNGAGYAGVFVHKQSHAEVSESIVVNSGVGFQASGNGWLELAHSTAMENTVGLQRDGNETVVYSTGNNLIHLNNINVVGAAPSLVSLK